MTYNIENYKETLDVNNSHSFGKNIQMVKLLERVSFET